MSEKRFKKMDTIIDPFPILDTVEELGYNCTDTLDLLVDLLNEQEATIQSLKEENEQLRKENERQNNEIKLLRKKITELMDDLEKIPLSIREMWFDE